MNENMAMSTIVTARARNIEGPVVLGEVVHLIRKKPRGSASSPASSDETAVPVGTIHEFLPPNAIPDNDRMYTRNDFFVSDCSVSGVGCRLAATIGSTLSATTSTPAWSYYSTASRLRATTSRRIIGEASLVYPEFNHAGTLLGSRGGGY